MGEKCCGCDFLCNRLLNSNWCSSYCSGFSRTMILHAYSVLGRKMCGSDTGEWVQCKEIRWNQCTTSVWCHSLETAKTQHCTCQCEAHTNFWCNAKNSKSCTVEFMDLNKNVCLKVSPQWFAAFGCSATEKGHTNWDKTLVPTLHFHCHHFFNCTTMIFNCGKGSYFSVEENIKFREFRTNMQYSKGNITLSKRLFLSLCVTYSKCVLIKLSVCCNTVLGTSKFLNNGACLSQSPKETEWSLMMPFCAKT